MSPTRKVPTLAISIGDPSGVGPEVIVKALTHEDVRAACTPLLVGDLETLQRTASSCGIQLPFARVSSAGEVDRRIIPVIDLEISGPPPPMGEISAEGGEAAWLAIERAVDICMDGGADALVTAPISKTAVGLAGRGHDGHTEVLQRMTGSEWALTLFVLDNLRILFFTRHVSLRDAIAAINADAICETLLRFVSVAPSLGLDAPRIAVAALNPHAGEGGLFGREEIDEIGPGVALARERGLDVSGPIPADTVFYLARQGQWDAVMSLYHDQAAGVPKSIDFHRTVSITLGLPFLRFSVDHGTAHDIAGKNQADAANMIHTLLTAAAITEDAQSADTRR